jgi:hypothetical protein
MRMDLLLVSMMHGLRMGSSNITGGNIFTWVIIIRKSEYMCIVILLTITTLISTFVPIAAGHTDEN